MYYSTTRSAAVAECEVIPLFPTKPKRYTETDIQAARVEYYQIIARENGRQIEPGKCLWRNGSVCRIQPLKTNEVVRWKRLLQLIDASEYSFDQYVTAAAQIAIAQGFVEPKSDLSALVTEAGQKAILEHLQLGTLPRLVDATPRMLEVYNAYKMLEAVTRCQPYPGDRDFDRLHSFWADLTSWIDASGLEIKEYLKAHFDAMPGNVPKGERLHVAEVIEAVRARKHAEANKEARIAARKVEKASTQTILKTLSVQSVPRSDNDSDDLMRQMLEACSD